MHKNILGLLQCLLHSEHASRFCFKNKKSGECSVMKKPCKKASRYEGGKKGRQKDFGFFFLISHYQKIEKPSKR